MILLGAAGWVAAAIAADHLALGDAAFRKGEYAAAVREYARAVQADSSPWAEYNLAVMYAKGLGVQADLETAKKWLDYASLHPEMAARAAALRAQLFPETTADGGTAASGPQLDLGAPATAPASSLDSAFGIVGKGRTETTQATVQLKDVGGAFLVPVEINGAITLDFTLDTGATDVSIPLDVLTTLARAGTFEMSDIGPEQDVQLADGSTSSSMKVNIHSLRVGDFELHNVEAVASPQTGTLLLGQSFLRRFTSWSMNNATTQLTLDLKPERAGASE
jgi:clan AA aspartic protease (TIGR02281 family)